jgi:hypothetical protein
MSLRLQRLFLPMIIMRPSQALGCAAAHLLENWQLTTDHWQLM